MPPDELTEFAREVRAMRGHQQAYFRSRDQADLKLAKDRERRVDEAIRRIFGGGQLKLFAADGPATSPGDGPPGRDD